MSLSVKAARNLVKTCSAAVTLGVALAPSNALAVTTWNWSFTTDTADQFGSGTFTTADVVPTPGTTYQITGVSGTYNRGGTAYTIIGLNPSDPNKFQWSGTTSSPILTGQFQSIGFDLAGLRYLSLYQPNLGFNPITTAFTTFSGSDGTITSSSLAPNSPPSTAVPGPLPLLGAAAAFIPPSAPPRRTPPTCDRW